jgi:nicotinamide mononucleotide transporter
MILLKETFSFDSVLEYVIDNWVELTGAILSLIYLILSVRQKIGLWIFGFLCAALYVYVFFQSKFYAGMTLQFYYMAVSIYGWIAWKKGTTDTQPELPVTRTSKHMAFDLMTVFLATTSQRRCFYYSSEYCSYLDARKKITRKLVALDCC